MESAAGGFSGRAILEMSSLAAGLAWNETGRFSAYLLITKFSIFVEC